MNNPEETQWTGTLPCLIGRAPGAKSKPHTIDSEIQCRDAQGYDGTIEWKGDVGRTDAARQPMLRANAIAQSPRHMHMS